MRPLWNLLTQRQLSGQLRQHAVSSDSPSARPSQAGPATDSEQIISPVDCPFEAVGDAANWIDAVSMTDEDRSGIVRGKAQKLFKLVL